MCASPFSPRLVFHIRRSDLWTVGLAPFLEWRGAGWKLPVSGIQAGEQNRPQDLQHSAEQRAADSRVTAGHLTHKPSTDRHGLSQKCFGHLATSRRFIPSALPCTSLNSEPQKAVWAVREREEQFLRVFLACVCSVGSSGGDTQRSQSKGFQRKPSKGWSCLALIKLLKTRLNEGKQIIVVGFECVLLQGQWCEWKPLC